MNNCHDQSDTLLTSPWTLAPLCGNGQGQYENTGWRYTKALSATRSRFVTAGNHLTCLQLCLGETFNTEYTLSCGNSIFIISRHNELRDLSASLLNKVCPDVKTKPKLQPVTEVYVVHASASRDPEVRLDIKAKGFCVGSAFDCAFFSCPDF